MSVALPSNSPDLALAGHPVLAGCVPASLGRRAAARVLDFALGSLVGGLTSLPMLAASGGGSARLDRVLGLGVLSQAVVLVVTVGVYVYLGRTGFLPGGRILGIRQVRFDTGGAPGWSGLVKYLLIALVAGVTFGIGYLVTVLLMKAPLRRGWHDRVSGLIVLDVRHGRDPRALAATSTGERLGTATEDSSPVAASLIVSVGREQWGEQHTMLSHGQLGSSASQPMFGGDALSAAPGPGPAAESPEIGAVPWRVVESPPARSHGEPDDPGTQLVAGPQSHTQLDRSLLPATDAGASPIVLTGDRGEHIVVTGPALLGRNPARGPGHVDTRLISLEDDSWSISKTHAAIGPDPDGIWVQDLHSTNGTAIVTPGGMRQAVAPGGRVSVQPGAELHLGQRVFQVGRP